MRDRRCRLCGKHRWFSSGLGPLCRVCEKAHGEEIHHAVRALDDARHLFEIASDPRQRVEARAVLRERALILLKWEEKGVPTSLPTPSELLHDLARDEGDATEIGSSD